MASREITGLDGSLPTAEVASRTEAAFGRIITERATKFLAVFRVVLGVEFLWAFLDKTFGLGYATPAARAWINGGSPPRAS
jgi:thiosulfate dehydrogenase [quinone] large subunit